MAYIWRPVRRLRGKRVISKKWYVRYRDHLGKLRVKVGYADKSATQQMAARLERETAFRKEGIPVPGDVETAQAPGNYLAEYMRHLSAKSNSAAHLESTEHRIRRILDVSPNLEPGPVEHFLQKLRTEERRSIGTSNGYLGAVKAFTRWLDDHDYIRRDPLRQLRKIKSEVGQRRRRCLNEAEFAKLVAITEREPARWGLSGLDRAMLYLVAAYTGLRWSELHSLQPESFLGDTVTVLAGYSKNKQTSTLPVPVAIRSRLRSWLESKSAGEPLWRRRWVDDRCGAQMLRDDLAAAGIPFKTAAGVFDFHSLRGQFITNLALAGVPLVHAQRLARHSTPVLTANVYSRLTINDLAAEVAKLSAPPAVRLHDQREAV
jgi:integrase